MTIAPHRQPSGIPTGGQFAAVVHGEPDVQLDDGTVNGLIAQTNALGRWMLVDVVTKRPVRRGAHTEHGSYATQDEALEWARDTYPLVSRIAGRMAARNPAPSIAPLCGTCEVPMVQTVDDSRDSLRPIWVCPLCDTP